MGNSILTKNESYELLDVGLIGGRLSSWVLSMHKMFGISHTWHMQGSLLHEHANIY